MVSVGAVERTTEPEPVEVVTPVPPFVTASVPVTPVVSGRPVAFVNVPDDGVPSAPPDVSKVELAGTFVPLTDVTFGKLVVAEVINVVEVGIGVPLMLVAVAVPRLGVVRLGEVERTTEPEPVDVVTPVPPAKTGSVPAVRAELEVE